MKTNTKAAEISARDKSNLQLLGIIDEKVAEIAALKGCLTSIGDLAHDTSTGPATYDTYWEIRSMAYEAVQS